MTEESLWLIFFGGAVLGFVCGMFGAALGMRSAFKQFERDGK